LNTSEANLVDRIQLLLPRFSSRRLLAIHRRLGTRLKAEDVTETLNLALLASKLDHIQVVDRPRLLLANGASIISAELAEWLDKRNIGHVRSALCDPQTQG
jgi:putative transposase